MDFGDISSQLDEIPLGDSPTATRRSPSPPPWDTQQVPETEPAEIEEQQGLEEPPTDGDIGSSTQDITTEATAEAAAEGPRSDASNEEEQSGDEELQNQQEEEAGFESTTPTSPPSTTASAPTSTPPLSSSTSTIPTTADSSSSALPPSAVPLQIDPALPPTEPAAVAAPTSESPRKSMDASKQPRLGTSTPNVLQKLVSMTRQRDLPPKAKEEEKKHLRELEEMRTAAKEAEKRRLTHLHTLRAARTARLASAFPTWESSILPNWRVVLHLNAEGAALRKLWWEGTMPVRWRGRLWGLCIGNGLALSKGSFGGHLERARRGEGKEWEEVRRRMEEDVEGTLPSLKLFQKSGVMHQELVDVLLAYTRYEASVSLKAPRYPMGLACPAAMLLVNMPVTDAWLSLVNLVNKSYLKSFYSEDTEECEAYCRIFDTLLADSMPKIYENFSKEVVRPALYLAPWLSTVYVRYLPLDLSTHLFDIFLLEGDSFLFRVALVLLQILEPRLFNPVQEELDAVFRGEDRGAVAIVRRQKGSGDGGEGEAGEGEQGKVEVEEVYEEMGVSEEAVFRGLREMVWREETWERLVTRELPEAD